MFDQCLYFNTTALARVLEREWTKAFKPFGLTPSQAFMLRLVLDQPGLLQSELARQMVIQRPTATRALDGLQKLGLVERNSTANDARELAIFPTSEARAMQQQLNAASGEVTRRLKKELGIDEFSDVVGKVKTTRAALT
jgi:DNA-binding MarR family transcriptional regulator